MWLGCSSVVVCECIVVLWTITNSVMMVVFESGGKFLSTSAFFIYKWNHTYNVCVQRYCKS